VEKEFGGLRKMSISLVFFFRDGAPVVFPEREITGFNWSYRIVSYETLLFKEVWYE